MTAIGDLTHVQHFEVGWFYSYVDYDSTEYTHINRDLDLDMSKGDVSHTPGLHFNNTYVFLHVGMYLANHLN